MARTLAPRTRLEAARRLDGATSSHLYALRASLDGVEQDYVLRLFTNAEWLADEPDVPLHEASSLAMLQAAGLPVPRLVALDAQGAECGVPALLMTCVPGSIELTPPDMDRWLDQLAGFLPRLHAVPVDGHAWEYFPYVVPAEMSISPTAPDAALWQRAVEIGSRPFPFFQPRFIHRDYHPVNVLFQAGQLSGVVDWPNACRGPVGVDVAHCRSNLALMYGVAVADRFLELCQQHMRAYWQYDPFWDLMSILDGGLPAGEWDVYPPWLSFGLSHLTPSLVHARQREYLASVLARFS